ncbi:MAG TPA: hypothetical protein VGZ00_03215 [Candidatus Baltobacteraceae bacterium]|jgi:hypothetical protein|nr:hypothetical protein [Candidatus Baltobacteraceae bacterium]
MGLKGDLEKAGDHIKEAGDHLKDAGEKVGKQIKDGASEAAHRVTAEAERKKRELLGDKLPADKKAESVLKEAENNVQANVDAAKRKINN